MIRTHKKGWFENMNKNLMEKRIHGEADFPISFYEQSFEADEEVLAPLHYHAEMELLAAKKGKITVRFDGNEMELEEGEGLFINSSKLHACLLYTSPSPRDTR